MKNTLNILAIEGCQGAGKSTLGVQLFQGGIAAHVPLIDNIKRPKMFTQDDGGAGLSLMTDIMWFSSAVVTAMLHPNPQPIMLDRFILSQWVYGTLRGKSGFIYKDILERMLTVFTKDLSNIIARELALRSISQHIRVVHQINLVYLLLLPNALEINRRRATVPYEFTYTAKQELRMYYEAVIVLDTLKIPTIILDGTEKIQDVTEKIDATFLSLSS